MRKFIILIVTFVSCTPQNNQSTMQGNRLASSTSPYLLQHANNPVDWYPWGPEALERAMNEDKPILVSIGYSSCHWCHVMAHESFEDTTVARIMNEHFINIKIDREERPDIDQIYMSAVQTMGLNGGWPLNVFLTPDQKPFYGGTYFPKGGWIKLLNSVIDAFENNREKLNESAEEFTAALNRNASSKYYLSEGTKISDEQISQAIQRLSDNFDSKWGGILKSPKFPVPTLWASLATWDYANPESSIRDHFLLTLDKIACGGIYDHIGGGFARYSTDSRWHVPHFEKMLYDNGQLLSLYAIGYRMTQKSDYLEVMQETSHWLEREMKDPRGGYAAALDADSEGEEGKFYVWNAHEVKEITGDHFAVIADYYDVSDSGNWEHTNVLRTLFPKEEIANRHGMTTDHLNRLIASTRKEMLVEREMRPRPGLDNKVISGWNGLTLTGLLDAHQATRDTAFLDPALELYRFINRSLVTDDRLLHIRGQETEAFADDYAAVIQAFIKYYETFFDPAALRTARRLMERMNTGFWDPNEQMYYYTSASSEELITRQKEMMDNVIPASNSIMAENLLKLGLHLDNATYRERSRLMVDNVSEMITKDYEFMANWAHVAQLWIRPLPEIAIIGPDALQIAQDFNAMHLPNKVISASTAESDLPLLAHKTAMKGETTIYVCYNKTCKRPVTQVEEALEQIEK